MCVFITTASCFPVCHSHCTGQWWWSVDSVQPRIVGLEKLTDRQTVNQSVGPVWTRDKLLSAYSDSVVKLCMVRGKCF